MIRIIKKDDVYFENHEWLRMYSLLSFSNYLDPDNVCFGILTTLNEYFVAPGHGFPMHPHQNMELLYIILGGQFFHRDSMGNDGVVSKGAIQRVSAGSGMARSTYNAGSEDVHYVAVWLLPKVKDIAPSSLVKYFNTELYHNKFFLIASDRGSGTADGESPIMFNAAASVYVVTLDKSARVTAPEPSRPCRLIFVMSGCVQLNGQNVLSGDHARVTGDDALSFTAVEASEILLIEMNLC